MITMLKNFIVRQTMARSLLLGTVLALYGCASAQLDTGLSHPANARAATAALFSGSSVLGPDEDLDTRTTAHRSSDPHAGHDHEPAAAGAKSWTCSMHPEVVKDEPGKCPICGMRLIEKKDADDEPGDEK
jgi:hypothetical protein